MNNKELLERLKLRIAISISNEEDIVMDKKKSNILKNMGITACALLSMTGIVYATSMIINKFGPNSSTGSQIAVDNGYIKTIEEDSIVDSFMIDNYSFYISFNKDKLGFSYDDIIQKGINQNKNTPSKYLKDKEKAVLNRLQKYRENYLKAESAWDFQKLLFAKEHIFLKQSVHRRLRILTGALCNPLLKLYHWVKTKK